MRILITGMGGELGTAVAQLLEGVDSAERVAGVDLSPPRRRLLRAEFHRVDPRDRDRMHEVITELAPTVLVHLGVYEPFSRSSPRSAVARTAAATVSGVGAALDAGSLEGIVVRSGIEVYGRRRGAPIQPDEEVRPDPTCAFGHSLLHAEQVSREAGRRAGVPVTLLRFATIVGPHVPSPLGRLLRLPAVPFSPLGDPPFSVLHQDDAIAAFVAAVRRPHDGPVNVVGPGAVTASQSARLGGRLPIPVVGPGWRGFRGLAELAGAPVPDHVDELLRRGRTADGSRAGELLGLGPVRATPDVVRHLYEWSETEYVPTPAREAA
jgi:UDP-glucose 4-epimerase